MFMLTCIVSVFINKNMFKLKKNSLRLISRDSRTPRNSGTFKLEGENVTGYRYMIHLYCLAVQAGFYSDVVECRTLSPADWVRSPVGEKCYFHFFTC